MKSLASVFSSAFFVCAAVPADAATVFSEASDASVSALGNLSRVSDTAVVSGYESSAARSGVLVFLLPTLAPGESIASASLGVRVVKNAGLTPTFNLDLYGLGFRASDTVLGTDYYSGTLDTTDATLLVDNFFTPSTADGNKTTSVASLTTYLNDQILAGGGGNYIFIRASADIEPVSDSSFYYLGSDTNTTYEPRLTFTIVPEPGAMLLAGVAMVIGCAGRRRSA